MAQHGHDHRPTGGDHHHDHDHDHDHEHEHGHGHGHGMHVHAPASFGRAFLIGIALNSAFLVGEWLAGLHANSLALIADAAHNLSDVLSLVVAWVAIRLSARLPSARFTYGLRGSSILAALVNAFVLLLVTGGLSWAAILRLQDAQPIEGGWVVATALIGIAVNGITAWLFMAGQRHDLNVRAAYLHMASDAAVSLVVVIAGGAVIFTQWYWLDPLLTLAVSIVIVWQTAQLLMQSLRLALQGVPHEIDSGEVKAFLAALPGVTEVHDLHIWAMSTTENALTAHLVIPGRHPGDGFLQSTCEALRQRFGIHHPTLQIEVADTAVRCELAPDHVV
jgi:cobalt-zinc-cadmium efflux system protein